ncbi:unnamed protein product [Parascedosporium putredinis]|uniref:TauD/TfdA-like domain-containing protein n=1 Tax=Parascedosporium putredinis TaxID=1442378 RepID=A0A9P1GXC3_9PEZI|nr:unnamed protein product [Parascedosporium putredinis]CAI7989635.1 unnamed protein product [Parascedosporium putredinis]
MLELVDARTGRELSKKTRVAGLRLPRHPSPTLQPQDQGLRAPEAVRKPITPGQDRATFADPEKKALLSAAKRHDLTESVGTVLEGIQLSQLTPQQLDELALLVTERGVVFFREQDLTTEGQVELFQHYGILDRHPAQKDVKHVIIRGSREDHREILNYTPWPSGDFHADTSFEYGLYDALSDAMKGFVDGLHAVHTSRLQYDTIIDLWGVGPNRPPIDTHHPAVRTHPVTGLKALNLLDFFSYHIHSADDHYVRWKWAVGSVAMWDNRCTVHRVIPGTYEGPRRGIRTTVFGEKPSEGRAQRQRRRRAEEVAENGANGSNGIHTNGAHAVNGTDGSSTSNGTNGAPASNGANGVQVSDGANGTQASNGTREANETSNANGTENVQNGGESSTLESEGAGSN